MKHGWWAVAALLLSVVVGCGALPVPGTASDETTGAQTTTTPLPGVPAEVEELIQTARAALGERLQQADAAIELVDVEPAEWPTAAMGCPQPDQTYAQVNTPGYVVRLKVGGNAYELHVGNSGQVVFCEPEQESRGMNVPTTAEPAVMAARRDLAARLGVDVEEVQIKAFEAVEWPDSSLGCPEPGRMYLQVITPGYRINLQAAGQSYEYHTNQGNRAVLCGKGPAAGLPSQKLRLQELRDVVERVRNDLAQRLGVAPAAILVAEALPLTQVGQPVPCPGAGQITGSGNEYQISLQVEGSTYIYRARGDDVVLCSQ